MKIGVDVSCWDLQRGFGRHTRCLLSALLKRDAGHEFTLFVSSVQQAEELNFDAQVVVLPASGPSQGGGGRTLGDLLKLSWVLSRHPLDVLFFPASYSFVPVWTKAVKLVMFHDITGFLFPQMAFGNWKAALLWKIKTHLARLQADKILTVSRHSQIGLAQTFAIPEGDIRVVGEAADPVFVRLKSPHLTPRLREVGVRPDRRYLVYLGGFGPLKNLNKLVEAFAELSHRDQTSDVDLIMVGPFQKEAFYSTADDLRTLVEAKGLSERIVFTGFLPDEEMVHLFNLAEASALVSYNEGFGLPAVEGAACGCPTVSTLSSPLPELLGQGGLYVDPHSVEEIQEALWLVLTDSHKRQSMAQAAWQAAQQLSWTRAAEEMIRVLEDLS
jgi:glycosyltransferase involved in cell wall biosynthesis